LKGRCQVVKIKQQYEISTKLIEDYGFNL